MRLLSAIAHSISLRGVVVLTFLTYLLVVPAIIQTDIIAWMFVVSVGILLLITTLLTLFGWYYTKNFTSFSIGFPYEDAAIQSKMPIPLVGILERVKLPPFVTLNLSLSFGTILRKTIRCDVKGSFPNGRARIPFTISFPHRGKYSLSSASWTATDPFGFITLRGLFAIPQQEITISPLAQEKPTLPVFTSSFREGDTVPHHHEPTGDMYDLKKYHPSDGLKKIVWKIFARTGELLSRHPERTMTPEGSVFIFCCALPSHDSVAAMAEDYCRQLEEVGVEIRLGCLGMQYRSPATNSIEAKQLLIESVWDTYDIESDQILGELNSFIELSKPLVPSRIVVIADTRVETEETNKALISIGNSLKDRSIEPIFVLPKFEQKRGAKRPKGSFIRSLFFENPPNQNTSKPQSNTFQKTAAQHRWDVVAV